MLNTFCSNNVIVRRALIRDGKEHRNHYMRIFVGEDRYNYILNGLHPPQNNQEK